MTARCSLCERADELRSLAAVPATRGRLAIDRVALRHALGGRAEVMDALPAKASGRPGVNAAIVWKMLTASLYQSGDLPLLATREAGQNSIDSIRAAIKARQVRAGDGRFEVTWDADARTLSWDDNGIGMDAATITGKFLVIGESGKRDAEDSGEAAGGFGVAKAVILGVAPGFVWDLHTRDNLAVARGPNTDVEVFDAEARQGTRITTHGVSEDYDLLWDRARQTYVPLLDRLRELLAANDLPGITLVLNGDEVAPMFSRRGGSKVRVEGSWGAHTMATVKAYRRAPGDRGGAYYVRLGGLYQFKLPSARGGLRADVVIDLVTTVRPGQAGYPLNAARDALQDDARWAFSDLVDEVERENESVGRNEDDEVYDPASEDPDERAGADELGRLVGEAFEDPALQKALSEATGGIMDFYAERLKRGGAEQPVASLAPRGSKGGPVEDEPRREPVLPPGFRSVGGGVVVEVDIAAPSDVAVVREYLEVAAEGGRQPGTAAVGLAPDVIAALDRVAAGSADETTIAVIEDAIERAADGAMAPGGAGLMQVARVPGVLAALDEAVGRKRERRNPFGKHAGLRISKKTYDRQRSYRFKKNYGRWLPYLVVWDGALRLIAAEARIRRRFKPGFVLDDNLVGLTAQSGAGDAVVYIHPDKLAQVVRAHRERPIAIAAFVHGVAAHELTHLDHGLGHGHDERFIAAREDLGAATGHLLPAIALLAQKVLGLPEVPDGDAKRGVRLERDLDRMRATLKEQRTRIATLVRADVHRRAEAVFDAAAELMRARPPEGIDSEYVVRFIRRQRLRLVALVATLFRA